MTSANSQVSLSELPMDNWMANLPSALWDTPLCYMAIPGSHNAITYCLDKNDRSPVDLTQPDMLQKLDKYMKPIIRPFVYKWAIAQKVLKEIREWLDVHPKEVVILSFSHFLDLNQERHTQLVSTIKSVFDSKLCPIMDRVTLRTLWSQGHQVIVSYEDNIAYSHRELWFHIPYWWANKCKAEALIEEFERRKQNGRPGGFFVTGINLTEDLKYICSHPTESLKDVVMSTYPELLSWVKQQKPGSNPGSLNIIAGDFVTESQFIATVIALNENLLNRTIIPEP
ncbi:PI-PLC X domain-containing protein 1 isoform X2 [Pimephales promelas]|uniref:PI-PLC X domain-containing protein 1 isoform X2 n=1 Tax=Pimephales promelas TaxID=90988 RepID=UPI001955997C|nr:PI-PLC X domain-containing protein 1 isoform X2 [Pimephales promelas]KAG1942500.1 PI-PLC X domain-containing protein [Pimephales promelas]KAG1942504.1 PI-PLC X domain-containing protein [Pimephales promelas]